MFNPATPPQTVHMIVAAVIWGWGIAQYPMMLPGLTIYAAAGDLTVLRTCLWVLGISGLFILVPSLLYLFTVFQSDRLTTRKQRR